MADDFLCVGCAIGHTCGVRVDGPLARGFLRFLSLTAFQAEGGGGALRAQIIKKPARALRHFDRSEAEWRNLPPLMVQATLGWEISRLRVSSEQLPSAPYRHAAPLEMTKEPRHPTVMLKKGMRLAPESLAVRMQKKRSPSFRGAFFHLRGD